MDHFINMNSSIGVSSWQIAIALTTVYLVWGSTYLAIRYTVETMPPFLMAAVRFLLSGAILYGWLRRRGSSRPDRLHWRSAFIIGGLLLVGGNGGVVWAELTVPSGLAALLVSMVPLWMALFDWARPGGRRPGVQTMIGLVLGFIGLVILVGWKNLVSPFSLTPGVLALLFAPIAWSLGSVYAKRAPLPSSPFMTTSIEMMAGGALLLLVAAMTGEFQNFHISRFSNASWIGLVYLIIIGSLVGFTAYIWLLKHASLSVASTYAYVNPVVAVVLGWLVAGETLSTQTFVGGFVILAAVALITTGSKTPASAAGSSG